MRTYFLFIEDNGDNKRSYFMLNWSLTFFVIALIAAVFGFGGIAGSAAGIAKFLFFGFVLLFAISLILNIARGKSPKI